jgi:hypothetical protein
MWKSGRSLRFVITLCVTCRLLCGQQPLAQTPQRLGPFTIGGESYSVIVYETHDGANGNRQLVGTLPRVEITDATGRVVYEKSFAPTTVGPPPSTMSLSARLVTGNTGTGLVLSYREQTATAMGVPDTRESWQLFGHVNGALTRLGTPTPVGGATAAPFMGVMMRSVNGRVVVTRQPDTFELRAWAGAFYVMVPLRVDWTHGGLGVGERCVEMFAGTLKDIGCDLRVEATSTPLLDPYGFIRMFSEPHDNFGQPDHVVIPRGQAVDILGARAITNWRDEDERTRPMFADIWLHVRTANHEGWIHGDDDFAAVGVPVRTPTP